ncbi:bestrophin family protein [Sphingobacterium hungaricum]|uniref:Bestrophin, RFP-TM, chloride channel n=1 Tax=Sphingobacterium hungaricum TaxID=2082723 RepID=A0A928V1W7_9SPHI|nr:bestrophin family ion channel [Sphingobacterium hungaricum]MBE8715134.1 hypothetical protein [Sphingobacterium hungaricum]
MLVKKNVTFKGLMRFAGHHLVWLTLWAVIVASLYYFTDFGEFTIPWVPLSVIGTAVAFYVGFKNNQAYDRLWEARKIWGAIVNSSRSWSTMVKNFVGDNFTDESISKEELLQIKLSLIFRHIAWLYTLRSQLLLSTQWEHASLRGTFGKFARLQQSKNGVGLFNDQFEHFKMERYLSNDEIEDLKRFDNPATQLIDKQTEALSTLRQQNLINDFRQVTMQNTLNDFYNHQGMAERIKKFPLPRQYGNITFIFVCVFIFMLPFGIVSEFSKIGDWGIWLSIPFVVIVGWMFVCMELVGDYSENPFEGLPNDVPMLSICRTIEIDLLQMIGEQDIPKPIQVQRGILM